MKEKDQCELCNREGFVLEKHHLIPRSRHSNKKNKREFPRSLVHTCAQLCKFCHKQIHATFTIKELETEYNTLEALAAHEQMAKFLSWVRKKSSKRSHKARISHRKRMKE